MSPHGLRYFIKLRSDPGFMTSSATRILKRVGVIIVRLAVLVCLAALLGWFLNHVAAGMQKTARPAGFARGMLQGALMPMALPNLLVGKDVTIYSENNTGVSYKLGYTAGVNLCGAIFFGFLYFRIRKLRHWALRSASSPASSEAGDSQSISPK
jgi:hypothetical protein